MKNQNTFYEVWFQEKNKPSRDYEKAISLSDAKKIAKKLFKNGSTGIVIDSWRMEGNGDKYGAGDIDDNSRKHYSFHDGKTFKQF